MYAHASQVLQALQLLRQHLVMTELYQSCFAPRDVVQDGMDSENTVYTPMIPYMYTHMIKYTYAHTHTHTRFMTCWT
jgi:hypothetical protein